MVFQDFSFAGLSASTLLAIVVILILRGMLVPRRTLQDKSEESERWHSAYEHERTARGMSDAQVKELLEVAKMTNTMIRAMAAASSHISSQAGDEDAPTQT